MLWATKEVAINAGQNADKKRGPQETWALSVVKVSNLQRGTAAAAAGEEKAARCTS
jgi:hypothetical protein